MNDIIKARLAHYNLAGEVEQEHATKEVIQEIALYALWRAKFFDVAVFQGGTSLRILHKLPRFSEDLDFMLLQPDPRFDWGPYTGGTHSPAGLCVRLRGELRTLGDRVHRDPRTHIHCLSGLA